jgi:hypothetical protein
MKGHRLPVCFALFLSCALRLTAQQTAGTLAAVSESPSAANAFAQANQALLPRLVKWGVQPEGQTEQPRVLLATCLMRCRRGMRRRSLGSRLPRLRRRERARRWCNSCGHETDFTPYEESLQLRDLLIDRGEQAELQLMPAKDSRQLLSLESLCRVAQSALVNRAQGGAGKDRPWQIQEERQFEQGNRAREESACLQQ